MYKETLGNSEKQRLAVFLLVLLSAFLLWLLTGAIKNIFPFIEVVCYFIFGAITFLLTYKIIREYRYSLDGTTLYIERVSGKRVTLVSCIDMADAIFEPYSDDESIKPVFFTIKGKSSGAYQVIFTIGAKKNKIVFHPSKELIKLIEEASKNGPA